MKKFGILFFVALALGSQEKIFAQDKVHVLGRKDPILGKITQETVKGITLGKEQIPALDIVDVEYGVGPDYNYLLQNAFAKEKLSLDPTKSAMRKTNLSATLDLYETALKELKGKQKDNALRNVEFKLAWLSVRQVHEDNLTPGNAVARLLAFKSKYPDSWQFTKCMIELARLQTMQKKESAAKQTLQELASKPGVPEEIRQEAEVQAALISVMTGNPAQALKELQNIKITDLRLQARARIAQAECLIALKDSQKANDLLRLAIKDTNDNRLKGLAHNALGKNLYSEALAQKDVALQKELLKEARWEFLWVDRLYSQDLAEHAKALFYLTHIFQRLGDTERAQEIRENLMDAHFAGQDYQKYAKDGKNP